MAATTSYYHFDAQGSTACLTNASQAVTDTYSYRPFGNGSAGTTKNPYTYLGRIGYQYDGYNVFLYVRARWYDTNLCRWFSQDPIGFNGGDWNLYRYAGNNPVNAIDPSGWADGPLKGPTYQPRPEPGNIVTIISRDTSADDRCDWEGDPDAGVIVSGAGSIQDIIEIMRSRVHNSTQCIDWLNISGHGGGNGSVSLGGGNTFSCSALSADDAKAISDLLCPGARVMLHNCSQGPTRAQADCLAKKLGVVVIVPKGGTTCYAPYKSCYDATDAWSGFCSRFMRKPAEWNYGHPNRQY